MSFDPPPATLLDGRPLVTLVVPCHGEGRYLDDCLRSIRAQDHRWLEIIVIDDAGHDDSAAVAAEHALADPRVVVVRLRRNVGLGAVRNYGLRAARGELIGFVDGDDLLPPDSVSARVAALAGHLHDPTFASVPVAGVYGDWDYVAPAVDEHVPVGGARELVPIDLAASAGDNVFIVSAPLMRTDVLRATGGFAEGVSGGEDHIAWMRVLATGAVFVPCRSVVAHYRQKPTSMVRSSVAEYAALTAASRRQLAHERTGATPAGPAVLTELAAGEHTIAFGVVEEQRPAPAARGPAASAAVPSPAPAASTAASATDAAAAAPWPDRAPTGPPDGSHARGRIAFGAALLAGPEPPQRPDADVIVADAGALRVIARPGAVDGPLRRPVPVTPGNAPRVGIRARSALGGVAAMAAALVLEDPTVTDSAVTDPVDATTWVPVLLLSATARHAALAAAAAWGRLPSAMEIAAVGAPADAFLEARAGSGSGATEVVVGLVGTEAGEADEIDGAALVARLTPTAAARSGVLTVLSYPGTDVAAIRESLGRATAAAESAMAAGPSGAPMAVVAAGDARAARILADHGMAVRVAALDDLAGAAHVVTDDATVARLAAAVGTPATMVLGDGAVSPIAARSTPAPAGAALSEQLAGLVRRAVASADVAARDGDRHDSPPPAR